LHLTEYARNRLRNAKDSVLVDFMDLFHHRLLSLFYRAWADKEPTVHFDRPEQDRFKTYIGALLGIGSPALQQRDAMPDLSKLHFSAHLGCHNRHAEGLQSIIAGFFRLPVRIHEFVGEWLDIPKDSYCYLRPSGNVGQLGQTSVIGTRNWLCQHKFRIKLGPLGLADFERMLPIGKSVNNLIAIVRNYIGFEFSWDLNLILKKDEVPAAQLGKHVRLGWTTWIATPDRQSDADDLILNLETSLAGGGEF
jgi:type VI secretion system protein ImpH